MSLEPDSVQGIINTIKPYLVGALGAIASFLYDVINNERAMNYLIMAFWAFLGAMCAAWLNDELDAFAQSYPFATHGRGVILFFTGGGAFKAYPLLRESTSGILVALAERLRKLIENLK